MRDSNTWLTDTGGELQTELFQEVAQDLELISVFQPTSPIIKWNPREITFLPEILHQKTYAQKTR